MNRSAASSDEDTFLDIAERVDESAIASLGSLEAEAMKERRRR